MILKYQKLQKSGLTVFDRRSVSNILDIRYESSNPILHRLVRKNVLMRLKRDCYVLPEALTRQSRKIANELVKPSYISLWTALNDIGISTQSPSIIQSVTTKRSTIIQPKDAPTFSYQRLPERLFFGFTSNNNSIFYALPEKALLDLLYVQKNGFDRESIDVSLLNMETLIQMSLEFPQRVQREVQRLFSSSSS